MLSTLAPPPLPPSLARSLALWAVTVLMQCCMSMLIDFFLCALVVLSVCLCTLPALLWQVRPVVFLMLRCASGGLLLVGGKAWGQENQHCYPKQMHLQNKEIRQVGK